MLRALIWDVDGTLAETERDGHRLAFNQAFAEAGIDRCWDVETYGRLLEVTGGKERILHDWKLRHPGAEVPASLAQGLGALHRRKNALYAQIVRRGDIALRPGVARLLREARAQGLRQAIATTTSRENCEVLLQATLGSEAGALFDGIVCGEDVRAKKPDPEAYVRALGILGLEAGDCLAIEDSRPGFLAARAARLPCLLVPGVYGNRTELAAVCSGAVAVIGSLEHAPAPGGGPVSVEWLRSLQSNRPD